MDEPTVAARITDWLWALPAAFAAVLWRIVNGKAGKETIQSLAAAIDKHVEEDRQVHERIFEKFNQLNTKLADLIGEIRGRRDALVGALARRDDHGRHDD